MLFQLSWWWYPGAGNHGELGDNDDLGHDDDHRDTLKGEQYDAMTAGNPDNDNDDDEW